MLHNHPAISTYGRSIRESSIEGHQISPTALTRGITREEGAANFVERWDLYSDFYSIVYKYTRTRDPPALRLTAELRQCLE